jgi:kexin
VRTALQINPNDPDWEHTAVGRPYSYKYGYGSIDAWTYVQAAKTWDLVKPQAFLSLPPTILDGADISRAFWGQMSGGRPIPQGGVTSEVEVTAQMLRDRNFEKLEHITVKVWITHGRRGDVEVELVSPKGIKSVLAGQRKYDQDEKGFPGWRFMTLKHWYVPCTLVLNKYLTIRCTGRRIQSESGRSACLIKILVHITDRSSVGT